MYEAWNDIGLYFTKNISIQRSIKPYSESEDVRISYQSFLDRILCESSQLYVRLRERYYNWKYDIDLEGAAKQSKNYVKVNELGLKQYKLNLEMFVDLSHNINAIPVLITQARLIDRNNTVEDKSKIIWKYTNFSHEDLVEVFERTDEIIKQVSISKNAFMIDASKALTGKTELFNDHVHTSDEGSYLLAKTISKNLLDLITNSHLGKNF